MLYLEFLINNPNIDTSELRSAIYGTVEAGFSNIRIPSGLVSAAKSIYPEGNYVAICGYPYGITSPEVKYYEIIENSKLKVAAIDYVINEFYVRNLDLKRLEKELLVAAKICKESGVALRCVLEHRLSSLSRNIQIAHIVDECRIGSLILSTGNIQSYFSDSLINCYKIKERVDIDIGVHNNTWTEHQVDSLLKANGSILSTSSYKNI